jgi:hypothetical protein
MSTSYATQISREAPEIEALKLGLMEEARRLYGQPINLPAVEATGLSLGQLQAADLARQGIGSYDPFLQAGSQAVTQGMGLTQQGAQQLGNLDVSPQFGAAQGAFQGALGATSRLGGLGNVAAGYSAADTRRATQQLEAAMRGAGGIEAAGAGALQAGVGAAGLMQDYATSARAQENAITGGIGALRTARQGLSPYMQAGLTSSEGLLGEAAAAARTGAPLTFATERDLLSTARGTAGTASTEANLAAKLGEVPTYAGASMTGPGGINAQQVGTQGISAAAASPVTAGLQTYQMGPAQQITTQSFGAPGTAESMMSPYMQNVVDIQQREALRQDAIARQGRAAQALRAGAFGGTREGVVEAEAQRNLATQLGDIQAQGLQQAYQQAQQQFNAEQQARLGAQQANQAAGLTVGQQNLAAQLGVQQLGTQSNLQTSLANLTTEQQARVQSEANRLQASGMNQQAALQAALANQQAQMTTAQQNAQFQQQAGLATQALKGQYGLTGAQLGLQAAQQRFQQAGFDAQTAAQLAQMQQAGQASSLQQAAMLQGIGGLYGQQAFQQAQMGQAGSQLEGALAAQEAQLGLLPGQLAQIQAGIVGQQAGLYGQLGSTAAGLRAQQAGLQGQLGGQSAAQAFQGAQLGQAGTALQGQLAAQEAGLYGNLGQGIGGLAAQQAGLEMQRAGMLGSLGGQMGQLGVQQGALGQTLQGLGAADVQLMAGIGGLEQQNAQAQLDAIRATQTQESMLPFQQLGFVSDIYRGAPTTQMALTSQTAPSASPLQTALGFGIAGLGAASGAQRAGLFN